MHSVQRLYAKDIRELNSVSGRRVSELTRLIDERIKHSVLFAFVAVDTLQIGDEDGKFVGESASYSGSVWFSFESSGKVEAMEEIV